MRNSACEDGFDIRGALGANNRPVLAWRNLATQALELAICTTPLCLSHTVEVLGGLARCSYERCEGPADLYVFGDDFETPLLCFQRAR